MRDLASKSSDDTLSVLKEIIVDIDERCATTKSDVGKRLLCQIRNTMSDKAATEVRFNSLVEHYINETIPMLRAVREADLEGEDVEVIVKLNTFFCGMHNLVHFADNAVQASLVAEKAICGEGGVPIYNPQFQNTSESGTARLVRTASKALSRGGEKRKALTHLRPVLKEKYNTMSLPISNYVGNRFNILFTNSVFLYCLRNQIKELLEFCQTNQLLKSVLSDFNKDVVITILKVFGIADKAIFGPYWRALESKEIDLVGMNRIYSSLVQYFDEAGENPIIFLEGKSPFDEKFLHRDAWWDELFAPNRKLDGYAAVVAGILMKSFALFARRQFADHIDGGIHANLTADQVRGVPTHNMFLERCFGYWDQRKRHIPNMSSAALEDCLLFTRNETYAYVESKTPEERQKLIREAMKQTPHLKAVCKERARKIEEVLAKRLADQARVLAEKEEKVVREKEALGKVEAAGGLWRSGIQMEEALKKIQEEARGAGKKESIDALKNQLSYRKKVLQQTGNSKDWTFSENGRHLTVDGL